MSKKINSVKRPHGKRHGENLARYITSQTTGAFIVSENICITQVLDVTLITLHERFGWGPIRLRRFRDAFDEIWTEMKEVAKNDSADRTYTKGILDRRLKAAVSPEDFCPYKDRYQYDLDPDFIRKE